MHVCVGGEVKKPRFTQYFRGSLSGLTIRPGTIESQKVISCLQACKEGLDINSLESLDKSIKVGDSLGDAGSICMTTGLRLKPHSPGSCCFSFNSTA